jgi:glycine betaine catabolism A
MSELVGILGKPYIDVSHLVSMSTLSEVHDEITRGLLEVETTYTGGSLKWMGITAPWNTTDPYRDVNWVLASLSEAEFATFLSLADVAPAAASREYGDETDRPLSWRQMRWLEIRHGVYFPWKTCYHFLKNDRWDDKHSGEDKDFEVDARAHFPKTIAMIEALPFTEIGRAVLFGVHANDHAPFHRDSEPGKAEGIAHSLSIQPDPNKKLVLASEDGAVRVPIEARVFWFNDMDYHGVDPAPVFRYSIRVDGVFDRDFLRGLGM